MQLSAFLAATFAGLVLATPTAVSPKLDARVETSDVEKRGVLAELCIAFCLITACETPPTCAACLLTCSGTADAGEPVDFEGAFEKIATGEIATPEAK